MEEQRSEETLGPYRLTECRAEGHIARVCKGHDRATGQKVLVRIVDPLACRNEGVRAVLEELRDPHSPRRVQDPHILKILDVGLRGDSYYIVHEDAGGVPLDEYVKETRPALKESLGLARAIAECVRAIHGYRLVHGDLKPQNILVARDAHGPFDGTQGRPEQRRTGGKPVVKVALADLAHNAADAMISVYGELVGTPKYLSPEQIQGKSASGASDLFSLGVIFYELFSGREPFPAEGPVGYLHANVAADLQPLSAVDTTIPSDLSAVVARLLARAPRSRYRTAQALLDDLDRIEGKLAGVAPEPVPAGADSAFAPKAPPAAMSPGSTWRIVAVTAAITAVAILLAGFVVCGIILRGKLLTATPPMTPRAPTVIEQPPLSQPAATTAPPAIPAAEQAFNDTLAQAKALANDGKVDEAVRLWKGLRERYRDAPIAARIDAELAAALFAKAADLGALSKPAEALEVYRSIVRDYPGTPSAMSAGRRVPDMILAMAKALENQAEVEKALAMYESLLREFPGSPAAADAAQILPGLRLRQAQALESGQPEQAIALLRQIIASKGPEADAAKARQLLARALVARADGRPEPGHFAEALADYREAEQLDPALKKSLDSKEPELLARAAIEAKGQMKFAQAIALWKELQARYPGFHVIEEYGAPMAPLLDAANPPGATGPADEPTILWALAQKELNVNDSASAQPYLDKLLKDFPATLAAAKARSLLTQSGYAAAIRLGRAGDVKGEEALLEKIAAADPDAAKELARIKATPADMVYVPGGEFTMGISKQRVTEITKEFTLPPVMTDKWFGKSQPEERVLLGPFYIDRHPVTNAQYKEFVAATHHEPPPSLDWTGLTVKPGCRDKPVTDVTLSDAAAYAKWAGKRLPREAEWEKAARGIDGRIFPWGNNWDPSLRSASESEATETIAVDLNHAGRSPYGCSDMAGNVQEWTSDPLKPYPAAQAEGQTYREGAQAVRGTTHQQAFMVYCMTTWRDGLLPKERASALGFRCAQDAP